MVITSRSDTAVSSGIERAQIDRRSTLQTFLAIVEANFEQTAVRQLLGYMGMVQAARAVTDNAKLTVDGFYSDGYSYTFVRLDKRRKCYPLIYNLP